MTRERKKTPARETKKKRTSSQAAEEDLSFEEALERVEAIVARLESGEIPLEKSIEAYAEGTRLVRECLKKLEVAERTIQKLSEETEGFRLEPADLEEDGTPGVRMDEGGGKKGDGDDELPF